MIVLGRDHDDAIARLDGRTQGAHQFRCVLAIIILVVERYPVQREDVERGPGRKRVLKTAKHRGAVGGAAQTTGEAEKAERWGHRGRLRTARICQAPYDTIRYDIQAPAWIPEPDGVEGGRRTRGDVVQAIVHKTPPARPALCSRGFWPWLSSSSSPQAAKGRPAEDCHGASGRSPRSQRKIATEPAEDRHGASGRSPRSQRKIATEPAEDRHGEREGGRRLRERPRSASGRNRSRRPVGGHSRRGQKAKMRGEGHVVEGWPKSAGRTPGGGP